MTSRLRTGLAALVMPLALAAGVPAKEAPQAAPATFAAVVEDHFDRWDRNRDGRLSPREVEALVVNPRVTGDEAAAVAAIHAYLRNNRNGPAVTREFLREWANRKPQLGLRRDQALKQPRFTYHFPIFRTRIRTTPRKIFATPDAPNLVGLSQGKLGDCYYLAIIAAAIRADRATFRAMFRPLADGSCDVQFLDGYRVHVPPLTDAQIALTSSAGPQGLWLNVAEVAFGKVKLHIRQAREARRARRLKRPPNGAKGKKAPKDRLDLDVIARGGFPSEAIEVLSGTAARMYPIRHGKAQEPPHAADVPGIKTTLHFAFTKDLPRKFLYCCTVGPAGAGVKYPPGIVSRHAYAVIGYEPRTQVVTVMNPWGNRFTPRGPPGLEHGYPTQAGVFRVPLDEFVQIFGTVYYQTGERVRRR